MGKNILIVEDDQLALYGLSKALEKQALEIATAPTGKKALEKLCECAFDLCLVNMHLKDCDGVEFVKKIKDLYPETKIIVMTANSLSHRDFINNGAHNIDKGICCFITKPFDLCQMTEIVTQALKGEDFPAGFGFAENSLTKRKFERIPCNENIRLYMNVIDDATKTRQWSLSAKSIDISDGGIGILTDFPLKTSQVIAFGEDLDYKTGVVVWSATLDDRTCRAGIKFTQSANV